MNILDYIGLVLIGGCAFFCVIMGLKKRIFKKLAFIYSVILAWFISNKHTGFLLSEIDITGFENSFWDQEWTEKISNAIITVLGTIIVTVALQIVVKQIFKVVDGKFDNDINTEIMDRIYGALNGLFVFCHIGYHSVTASFTLAQLSSVKTPTILYLISGKNINAYRLVRNLN